jgi:hypothetical protein
MVQLLIPTHEWFASDLKLSQTQSLTEIEQFLDDHQAKLENKILLHDCLPVYIVCAAIASACKAHPPKVLLHLMPQPVCSHQHL